MLTDFVSFLPTEQSALKLVDPADDCHLILWVNESVNDSRYLLF